MSRTYKRKKNQESLGEVINRMLRVYRLKSGLTETILKSDWEKIVGSLIATHTTDILIRGKKLIIKVNSAALKHELHYQREDIGMNVKQDRQGELVGEVLVE